MILIFHLMKVDAGHVVATQHNNPNHPHLLISVLLYNPFHSVSGLVCVTRTTWQSDKMSLSRLDY